jgi:hypothetical protein
MSKAKTDLRSRILEDKGKRFRREAVEIEGLDEPLYIREISAAKLQELAGSLSPDQLAAAEDDAAAFKPDDDSFRLVGLFLVAGLVDEAGDAVFQEGDEDAILDAFSVPELMTLQRRFMALNRVNQETNSAKND